MKKILSLRIKKIYFDQIKSGEKTTEYRSDSDFYRVRLMNENPPTEVVLCCGRSILRRKIKKIELIKKPQFLESFDFLKGKNVFAIHLMAK